MAWYSVALRSIETAGGCTAGDAWDDDCDGAVNCADPDCATDIACQTGGACRGAMPIACGETLAATTFSGIARIDDLDCLDNATRGTEAVYSFVAPTTGTFTARLEGDAILDLAITPALRGACDLARCEGAMATGAGREASLTANAGDIVYLVVDGPLGIGAEFALTLTCP